MKDFDYGLLPKDGLALLTAPDIDGGPLYLADFRDSQVMTYKPTGHFLGFSAGLGIRLCKGPPRMTDGMWIVNDDLPANDKHRDVQLGPDVLDFVPI